MVCATGCPKSPNIILYYNYITLFLWLQYPCILQLALYTFIVSGHPFSTCAVLPNKGKHGRILIGFLPNKESISGARVNPMHYHSLGELASEEPSEPGRIVGTLHLRKPLSLRRRRLAPLLQRNRRRQQDLAGESCFRGRCARRHWRRREPSWLRGI